MKKLLYLLTFISSFAFAQTTVRMSATATGTDTYSTLFNPNVAAFNSSTIYVIPFTNANTSGTITLDPDGGGPCAAVSIKGDDGNDLAVGAIKAGGTYQFKFNGTLLRMIGSSGSGGGWLVTGTTNLTGDATVDNGVHNLLIGDLASGPWSYWDMDGTGPVGLADTHISGIGNPLGTEHSFVQESLGVAENGVVLQSSFTGGGLSGISILSSAGASGVNMFGSGTSQANAFVSEDGRFGVFTNNTERIHIDNDGSLDLGPTNDPGIAGYYLGSNGAGAAPTWQAPSGGGGSTAAGATGNMQYKSAGGGLQAEAALTYDSAANILTVPLVKITSGSPGAGKVLTSDADGDAAWTNILTTTSIVSVTGTATLSTSDFDKIILLSGTSSNYTVTLPTAVGNEGRTYCIKGDPEAAIFNKVVTLDGDGTEEIDAYLTRSIARGGYITIVAREDTGVGSWQVISFDQGDWISWTPTLVGISAVTLDYRYKVQGKVLHLDLYHLTTSTGSGTTVTFTLPEGFTSIKTTVSILRIINNGGAPVVGIGIGASGSNIIQCFTSIASGVWSGTGDRELTGTLTIPIN